MVKKRLRKGSSSLSSSSSSSAASSPSEAPQPRKKRPASPPTPKKSRTETSKELPPSTGKAVGSLAGSSRSTDQGTATLTPRSVVSGATGVQTKVYTPPAALKKPASKASGFALDTRSNKPGFQEGASVSQVRTSEEAEKRSPT
ncbi:uncharacterized protein [Macrobrachium rosenbergii]|uniref:uncharacterized protein n=1 Tax=Macrobrachium rosenbergii TaxID=79674 RepID=UPI0034D3FECC